MQHKEEFPHITDPAIQTYCIEHSSKPSFITEAVESATEGTGQYGMASGKYLGKFLQMMSMVIQPKTILEIGTFTGYGALCLKEGLADNGIIYTIEKDPERYKLAQQIIKEAPNSENIKTLLGDAAEIISDLDVVLDLVFIDAAKRQYSKYFDLIFPKLRTGGAILADNVLWKGKVGHPDNDKLGQGLDAFNKKIKADDRVENIILPIDDGVNFIIKK